MSAWRVRAVLTPNVLIRLGVTSVSVNKVTFNLMANEIPAFE